jgi:3',5'-cyclic AMP phosphodiesterase CpdA
MKQGFDNLSPQELDQIRLFIEAADILAVTDDIRELMETKWPCLSKNFLLRLQTSSASKSSRKKSVSAIPPNKMIIARCGFYTAFKI